MWVINRSFSSSLFLAYLNLNVVQGIPRKFVRKQLNRLPSTPSPILQSAALIERWSLVQRRSSLLEIWKKKSDLKMKKTRFGNDIFVFVDVEHEKLFWKVSCWDFEGKSRKYFETKKAVFLYIKKKKTKNKNYIL